RDAVDPAIGIPRLQQRAGDRAGQRRAAAQSAVRPQRSDDAGDAARHDALRFAAGDAATALLARIAARRELYVVEGDRVRDQLGQRTELRAGAALLRYESGGGGL